MATLSINDHQFNVMPETARWSYSMKINSIDTYGGRVIQLLACNIDSMTIEGYILPKKGKDIPQGTMDIVQWQGMREFEYNIKAIMAAHEHLRCPADFSFPELDWFGQVWLTGYTDVRYQMDMPAVRYTLQFDVDYGFDTVINALTNQTEIAGLNNIPNGVGWVRNIYNVSADRDMSQMKKATEDIVDAAGTFDASNPLDVFQYLMEAVDESLEEGEKKAVLNDAVKQAGDISGEFAKNGVSSVVGNVTDVTSYLRKLGLIGG